MKDYLISSENKIYLCHKSYLFEDNLTIDDEICKSCTLTLKGLKAIDGNYDNCME